MKKVLEKLIAKIFPIIFERISKWSDIDAMIGAGEISYFFNSPEYDQEKLIWKDGKWQETDNLIRMLIGLDVDLHEVEMDVIHKVTPEVDTSPYVRI